MIATAGSLQRSFSRKYFQQGMGVVVLAYCALAAYLAVKGPDTATRHAAKLATQVIAITPQTPPSPAPAASVIAAPAQAPDLSADGTPPAAFSSAQSIVPAQSGAAAVNTPAPAAAAADASLAKAPLDGLYEDTPAGRLPKIRDSDKMTPFAAYRRPFAPAKAGMPVVSVAVMDLGLSDTASKAVMSDLSPDVSVVLSPYANTPENWVNEARANGHEVWLELPVETQLYPLNDPGPETLLTTSLDKQNQTKLTWSMSRAQGYAGMVTGYQASFLHATAAMRPIVNEIYKRGLGLVDGDTNPSGDAAVIAAAANAPYEHADVWIDHPPTQEHIAASLRQLELIAQQNGSAIGFMASTPLGRKMLQTWIDGLPQKNIAFAPLSALTVKTKSP